MPRKDGNVDLIDVQVGERIRMLRHRRGWTQTELATRLGVSMQSIVKYERGLVTLSVRRLMSCCDVFGVDPNELSGWDHRQTPKTPILSKIAIDVGNIINQLPSELQRKASDIVFLLNDLNNKIAQAKMD